MGGRLAIFQETASYNKHRAYKDRVCRSGVAFHARATRRLRDSFHW